MMQLPRVFSRACPASLRHKRTSGQILVISAFAMIVFIGLIGTGVDYGLFLIEETQLQNALDSASLAGARALVSGTPPTVVTAEAVARNYLRLHGYEQGVRNTDISFTFPPGPGGASDTVSIGLSRRRSTYFWHVFGIPEVTIAGRASAQTGHGMFDVVFSADQTQSMSDGCNPDQECPPDPTTDMGQLRMAAADFVNQLNPSSTDPRSSKISIAQFQGQRRRNGQPCGPTDQTSGMTATTCALDAHVIQELTADKAKLLQIINGPRSGCPPMPSQPPATNFLPIPSPNNYRCPLHSIGGSGTYIKGGVEVAFLPSAWDLWSTAKGGRTEAKKAMVVFTDGQTNVDTPDLTTANNRSVAAANATKRGADGLLGTADDVEIFVVGLFKGSEAGSSGLTGTNPPGCPQAGLPSGTTDTDDLLIGVSSSSPGSCDHYYPLGDRTSLPQTFRTIAGAISRGRLTQ